MTVVRFERGYDRKSFYCGEESLNRYLREQVSQDRRRSLAACFVLLGDADNVLGYYTLAAHGIGFEVIPEELKKALPGYSQIPATLIGRLAIDRSLQGQGWGSKLLMEALERCWHSREEIGSWAVVVEAIDESAAAFYRRFGFQPITGTEDSEGRLFMPMKEIGKLL